MLHAAGVQAAFESYAGLPEANVGLIPAGGGTTEMILRAYGSVPPGTILERSDPYPFLRPLWENLRLAKFSSSADEARQFAHAAMFNEYNYLHPDAWELVDRVAAVFNRCVIWDAKLIHSATSYQCQRLVQLFKEKGINAQWADHPGGHVFSVWRNHLNESVPMLFRTGK